MPQRINPREFSPRARRRPGPLIPLTASAPEATPPRYHFDPSRYTLYPETIVHTRTGVVFEESPWFVYGASSLTVDGSATTSTYDIDIEPPRGRTEIEKKYDELRSRELVPGGLYMTHSGVVMKCVSSTGLMVVFAPTNIPTIEETGSWYSESIPGTRFKPGGAWHYIGHNFSLSLSPEKALEIHMNIAKRIEP